MSPERIEGVALVGTDERLLSLAEKEELTGGDTTALHVHIETGDIVLLGETQPRAYERLVQTKPRVLTAMETR